MEAKSSVPEAGTLQPCDHLMVKVCLVYFLIIFAVIESLIFSPFSPYVFNDTLLLPYTNYDYYIETTNVGGSVLSPTVRIRTLSGIPTGVPPLLVSNVRAHQANFEWGEPAVAHGPIETYVLQVSYVSN